MIDKVSEALIQAVNTGALVAKVVGEVITTRFHENVVRSNNDVARHIVYHVPS